MLGSGHRWLASCSVGLLILAALAACTPRATTAAVVPTGSAGKLRLTTDRSLYHLSEPVGVTISNTSGTAVYATDGRSACTFLELQRYDTASRSWVTTEPCRSAEPLHTLLIPGSVSEPFTFAPGDDSQDPNRWAGGVYRVVLIYTTTADGSGSSSIIYSPGFVISG
jgi:hypothetical protein